ncbi:MAG: hypothetical protein FWB75_07395 [Oscillospiraceae bacterium]|nr:hypothetical protein [Oscillospiraceae bacterium]
MQKKLLGIFSVLLIVLVGCGSADVQEHSDQYICGETYFLAPASSDNFIENSLILTLVEGAPQNAMFTITSQLFEAKENVNIRFPKIETSNQELQEAINTLILADVPEMLSDFPDWQELTLDVNYTIKFYNDSLLSIVYTGIGFLQGSARPAHLFYALNINLDTGKKIALSDVVNIDELFVAALLSESTTHINPNPELKQFVREIISEENFLHRLKESGDSNFYFTSNSLGISIGGLGGAAGDHAELEINLRYLIAAFSEEN